ncbi:hypothetical protein BVC80_1691g22 [Macleaya cordata]|uniref:Uncharacterized protein n=1 Tax=Macleaya cordata TaxID=56857 RepID=A0A200PPA4_MACCD|nr:hypothetical protein BVC80_1691g22 [Macleaya cordata]
MKNFEGIISSIEGCIQGWKGKLLSQASRTTLCKSVLVAAQTFQSTCLVLPTNTSNKIGSIQRDF